MQFTFLCLSNQLSCYPWFQNCYKVPLEKLEHFFWTYIFQRWWRAGVDFTHILRAAFTHADPKSTKIQSSHPCLFSLLGSVHIKAACKMLVKSTPEWVKKEFIRMSKRDVCASVCVSVCECVCVCVCVCERERGLSELSSWSGLRLFISDPRNMASVRSHSYSFNV